MKNDKIIILARCFQKKNINNLYYYLFNFKGYYKGNRIKKIEVCSKVENIIIGEEYIVKVKLKKIKGSLLKASLEKYKCLENIRIRDI